MGNAKTHHNTVTSVIYNKFRLIKVQFKELVTKRRNLFMKYCSHCGESLPDNARFCSKCGAAQELNATPEKEAVEESTVNETSNMYESTDHVETNQPTASEQPSDAVDRQQINVDESATELEEQETPEEAEGHLANDAAFTQVESDFDQEKSETQASINATEPIQANQQKTEPGDSTKRQPTHTFWQKYGKYIYPVAAGVLGAAAFTGVFAAATGSFSRENNAAGTAQVSTAKSDNTTTDTEIARTNTAKVANEVKDAVVSINNKQSAQSQTSALDDLFGSGNGTTDANAGELQVVSQGSGVIYNKEGDKAYIVTNNHVIQDAEQVEVILNDQTKLPAKVVGKDEYSDLAVLSVDSSKVKGVAEFGDSSKVQAGDPAIAMGSPLGSEYAGSVTEGIISAKDRVINVPLSSNSQETRPLKTIQTDAAINAGNSGGPLLNADGQVIGINSVKYSSGSSLTSNSASVEGMGFAIPSNDVVSIINELVKNGKISRPKLGIEFYDLSNIDAAKRESNLKLPKDVTEGVLVANVVDNSSAAKAGLKTRDVIVELDGEKVNAENMKTKLYEKKLGDTIELKYYRDGKEATVKVKLDQEQSNDSTTQQKSQSSAENQTDGNDSTLDDFFK